MKSIEETNQNSVRRYYIRFGLFFQETLLFSVFEVGNWIAIIKYNAR